MELDHARAALEKKQRAAKRLDFSVETSTFRRQRKARLALATSLCYLYSINKGSDNHTRGGVFRMRMEKWNQGWTVWREDNAFRLINLPPAQAKQVDLPYDAAFHQQQDPQSPNEGKTGFLNGGTWNYLKEYYAPEAERGMDLRLLLEGCAEKTYVFVNDSLAGENNYAYTEFYVDLSPYLRYGQSNRIMVTATSLELSSRFYCGGGIYRDVYLCRGGDAFFAPESLRVTTKALAQDEALVCLEAQIVNRLSYGREARLTLSVQDAQGRVLWQTAYPAHLPGGRTCTFSKHFSLAGIRGWDADHPALYQVRARLEDGQDGLLDEETITTGFRMVQVDAAHGLRINGRTVKLLGGCIHHDQGILGAETYDDYECRRVSLLKAAGFNAVRCAHNPASKALLRACDRLGMYVLDESFDMWGRMKNPRDYSLFFSGGYRDVLATMVRVDYNHPSVILYSTGNEIMDLATDKGYELCGEMTAYLHALDGTRFVTNAVNTFLAAGNRLLEITAQATGESPQQLAHMDVNQYIAEHEVSMEQVAAHAAITEMLEYLDGAMDVVGYNYMPERYEADSVCHPQRIILGTETHAPRIADSWRLMQAHPNIIGDFIWTSYGYLGETGGRQRFPALQNESCDLDVTGCLMPTNYYRQVVLGQRKEPYIAVRTPEDSEGPMKLSTWSLTDAIPCWDFPGCEGRAVEVEVYAPGDEVELFLNGRSCGRQPASGKRPCQAVFRIPYAPGELKAVALQNGQALSSHTLATTGKAETFDIRQEPPGDELIFVNIQAVNAQGQPVYAAIPDLTVSLEGNGAKLQAFGSYDAPHNGGYQSPVLSVKNGKALLILRKQGPEPVRLTVSAQGMTPAACMLTCG